MQRHILRLLKKIIVPLIGVVVTVGFITWSTWTSSTSRSDILIQTRRLYEEMSLKDPFDVVIPSTTAPPRKAKHVAFLKVHKAASTTVQNIFLRFGWSNDLTFILPPVKNEFGYPNIISLRESLTKNNTLPAPAGKQFDILCNHVYYDRKSFKRFLPDDTIYVGILREPYEMFKSILNYLKPWYIFHDIKKKMQPSVYLKHPKLYEPKKFVHSVTNSRMAAEFGFPESVILNNNITAALDYIDELDKDFGLVIIAEMMAESLVLMKRYLKWSLKDILYLDKNIANHKNKTALLGPFDRKLYRSWAKIDFLLYTHFYRRLREQIREEGSDFDGELLHFNELREMTSEFCKGLKGLKGSDTKLTVMKTMWNDAFNVTVADCNLLLKSEMDFVGMIRVRQYGT